MTRVRLKILAHLEHIKGAGPVYAKTSAGIAEGTGASLNRARDVLWILKEAGLVSASKPMIIGKSPKWDRRRPLVYEITAAGIVELESAKKLRELRGVSR